MTGREAGPIAELLRQQRFDEALARLYQAREENPGDATIPKTIQVVREQLTQQQLARLGPLDAVPARTGHSLDGSIGADEQYLLGLVDGTRTIDRLLDASTLGRHRTVRSLAWLVERRLAAIAPRVGALPERPPADAGAPEPKTEVRKVLVADSSTTQATITRTFARVVLGHAVQFVTVASGPEAVEAAGRERPDLLVVEFMLPGADGLETLRRIREQPETARTLAILVVQRVETEYVRGRVPPRTALLIRPVEKSGFAAALSQLSLRPMLRAS